MQGSNNIFILSLAEAREKDSKIPRRYKINTWDGNIEMKRLSQQRNKQESEINTWENIKQERTLRVNR